MIVPRDYQVASDEHLWQGLHQSPKLNPLVVMATGLGKSLSMAMFSWRMLDAYPHVKILNVTHVKELIAGNYRALLSLWPAAPAGVYSAGLGRKDTRAQITFCGIQSVVRRAKTFGHVDFVLIDEAHRISDSTSSTYSKFIAALRERNPNLVVIGFTATPFRMTSGLLTDGELFDYEVFNLGHGESFVWAIDNGYLIKPVPRDPGFQLDESAISIQAGEYSQVEASAALREQDILERAVETVIQSGQDRKAWLTFCQSIEDSELVADMFRYKGYPVEAVHSQRADRDDVLAKLKRGELRGVTNRDILTTGFDHPPIDLIAMLRLTRSPGLWVQMLGRGTRPVFEPGYDLTTLEGRLNSILASDKQTCLVLDFVGNTERLGPINYPVMPRKRGAGGGGDAPVRKCPQCLTYHHPSVKVCDQCGYEFPKPENIRAEASNSALVLDLSQLPKLEPRNEEVFEVHRMVCMHHSGRNGKPDSLRVDYFSGFNRYSSWICLAHPANTFPRRKAEDWWKAHGGQGQAPRDIDEAVEAAGKLNKPKFIKVWTNTKYPEVLGHDFRGTAFQLPPELGGPPLREPTPDPMHEELERMAEQQRAAQEHLAKVFEGYDDDIPF